MAGSLLAEGCGHSNSSSGSVKGAVAALTNVTGTGAKCIFPMETTNCYSVANYSYFEYFMVRPLVLFGGNGNTSISADSKVNLGPAEAPVYKNGGKTVVINFKPSWKWSNGQPVDAQDLIFFLNMLEANKAHPPLAGALGPGRAHSAGPAPDLAPAPGGRPKPG